jgi:DNA-binding MarR family transcriptional regulator
MLTRPAARGWLTQGPDPADGRRTRLTLTPAGQAVLTAAAAVLTAAAVALVAPLPGPDVRRLAQLLDVVRGPYGRPGGPRPGGG